MVEIICDQYGIYNIEYSDKIVTEKTQFEDALAEIESCSQSEQSLRIIVQNPALFKWFDAAIKYGAHKKIIDPIEELAGNLQQSIIPEYLQAAPHWIVELKLLEKSNDHPIKNETVDNWLKKMLLGAIWQEKAPNSSEDFSELFAYFFVHKESTLHPLERYLLSDHLTKWSLNTNGNAELFLWLKHNPFDRARSIVWEQLLSLFPKDRIAAWLQQNNIWYELSKYPARHRLPHLSPAAQLPENIAVFARSFLVNKWNDSPVEALSFISGTQDYERNFLLEQLRHQLHDEVAISPLVYELLTKLNFPEVLKLARQLIPVKKPSKLPEDGTISEVQNWMANEYLPYYNSCALLGQVASTEPQVTEFERWLEKHYTNMLFGAGMAYRQMSQIKACVLSDIPVLVIVYDGLDYFCAFNELLPAMQDNGFYPSNDIAPLFSFLPTQTHIAKPALVAGKMESQLPDEVPTASFYKGLLKDCLDIEENSIRSKTDKDGTLLELIQEPAKVYLYLDNYLDRELLHSNIHQYLRKKKYDEYIQMRAAETAQCIKDLKDMFGKTIQVVICSDHGYTTIPKNADIITVHDVKKSKVRTLFGSQPADINGIGSGSVWRLNPDLYGLNNEVLLPHGYSCFGKRPLGATHGGCTPQEMAVPWFLFSDDRPAPLKSLIFSLDGEIFRRRANNNLTLSISNPNNCQITLIEIEAKGLEITHSPLSTIGKNEIKPLNCFFDASAISDNNVEFSVNYRLRSLTGETKDNVILKVPTTGAMSTEFDDDFEF